MGILDNRAHALLLRLLSYYDHTVCLGLPRRSDGPVFKPQPVPASVQSAASSAAATSASPASTTSIFDIDDLGIFYSAKRCVPLFLLFLAQTTTELRSNHLINMVLFTAVYTNY